MNVIFVTNAYHPVVGGAEKVVAAVAKQLKRQNHHVEIVTARNPITLPYHEVIEGIPVYRLPFYIYRDSFRSAIATILGMSLGCLQLLIMAYRRWPCIIHVSYVYHNAVCVELIRNKLQKRGIPIVVTFHGGEAPVIHKSKLLKNPSESKILNWTAKRLIKRANALTAVSSAVRQKILDAIDPNHPRIQVIHNGVDADFFVPSQTQEEKKVILTISRLSYQKGIDILLKAFSFIKNDYPEWKLHIAGDGELRENLEKITSDLKLNSNVTFLGTLPHQDLLKEINSSAFVVAPSRWEGFSLAALEAMSCAKAIITTEFKGAKEMVLEGITGLIVPLENPEKLSRAIHYLINRPDLRLELGLQARQRVIAHYSWEHVASQYEHIYQNLQNHDSYQR